MKNENNIDLATQKIRQLQALFYDPNSSANSLFAFVNCAIFLFPFVLKVHVPCTLYYFESQPLRFIQVFMPDVKKLGVWINFLPLNFDGQSPFC